LFFQQYFFLNLRLAFVGLFLCLFACLFVFFACAYPQAGFRDKNIRKWTENSQQQQQVRGTKPTNTKK